MFKPNREFQAGLNTEAVRRQRQKAVLSLRRQDRQNKLQNKRKKVLQNKPSIAVNPNHLQTTNTPFTSCHGREDQERDQLLRNLPKYVQGCFTEHRATIFECTQKIRGLLSLSKGAPIKPVVDSGVIPRIIQFLRWKQSPELQFEAMWVLTNIASSENPEFTAKVVRDGAIPAIIEILKLPSYRLLEQAVWTLGNIAGDNLELRNLVMNNGVLRHLKTLCALPFDSAMTLNNNSGTAKHNEFVSMLRNLSWMISNLCRFGKHREEHLMDLVQCFADLLRQHEALNVDEVDRSQEALSANIGWSLTYLTNDMNAERDTVPLLEAMKQLRVTEAVIALLGSTNPFTVHSNLRAMGNVLTGNDRYTTHCIECGVLQQLHVLMLRFYGHSVNHEKLREICWAISNITAGPTLQIIKVIEAQFVPILMSILKGSRTVIASEALWAVSNATASADDEVMRYLVQSGLIEGLCQFLKNKFAANSYQRTSEKLLIATLECIEHILSSDTAHGVVFEEFGGVDFLEYLQSEDAVSQRIYEFAVRLIQTHYDLELDDDDDLPFLSNLSNDGNSNSNGGGHFSFGIKTNATNNVNQFEF